MADSTEVLRCGKCQTILTPPEPERTYITKSLPPKPDVWIIRCPQCGTPNRFPAR